MYALPLLSPVALSVKMLFGEEQIETFEFEFFLEDILKAIFNEQLRMMKKAETFFASRPMGLEVSPFIRLNEQTYIWERLQ
jgi:hypothetical protein